MSLPGRERGGERGGGRGLRIKPGCLKNGCLRELVKGLNLILYHTKNSCFLAFEIQVRRNPTKLTRALCCFATRKVS